MSSKARGKSFSKAELESLLEIIEEALPIGMNEWEAVLERHLTRYPDSERTRESIKRKFASLYNSKKPTGDPTCPPIVRAAKRTYNKIKERMDISDGEDDGSEEDDEQYLAEENSGSLEGTLEVNETQESMETPSDTNLSTSITTGGKSVGSEQNMAITPFKMITAPKTKRRAGTAFGAESDPFAEYLKLMLVKSDKDNEAQAARHKEQMEMMERKDRLEERRAERQDRMMQMMMMQITSLSSSASKKKKITLELSDNDDDNDSD